MLVVIGFGGCISNSPKDNPDGAEEAEKTTQTKDNPKNVNLERTEAEKITQTKDNPEGEWQPTEAEKMTVKIESEEVKKMIVKIQSKEDGKERSGFIVAAEGDEIYILTAPHDLTLGKGVKIRLSDQSEVDGEIKGEIDQVNDMAILAAKIKKTIEVPYFFSKQKLSQEEHVGKWFQLSGFRVAKPIASPIYPVMLTDTGTELLFWGVPPEPLGLSGGPIFFKDEEKNKVVVVGMAKTTPKSGEINAVPVYIIMGYLEGSLLGSSIGKTILEQQEDEKVTSIIPPPCDCDCKPPIPENQEPEGVCSTRLPILTKKGFCPPEIELILADNILKSNIDDKEKCAIIIDYLYKPEKFTNGSNTFTQGIEFILAHDILQSVNCPPEIEFILADDILQSDTDDQEKCAIIIDYLYKLEEFTKGKNELITRDKNIKDAFARLRDYQNFDKQICRQFR